MTPVHRWMAAGLTIGLATVVPVVVLSTRSAGEANAATAAPPGATQAADTAAVTRILTMVRGADALVCELAVRHVDMRGWWSGWSGSPSGGPLEVDSAAGFTLRAAQRVQPDARHVPRLADALGDGDRCVRRVAASFLGRTRDPAARRALLSALDASEAGTRAAAAIGLGLAEEPGAVRPLIARLRDPSADVRRSAAWALGAIEDKDAMLPLIEVLERDSDARVRQAAAWAIGQVTS